MPAIDSCHLQVVHALQKDGWNVNPKSPYILAPDMAIYVDIEARKSANGSGELERIYVEVKCLPGHNITQELYIVFGQYLVYRALLATQNISVPLFLAIPQNIYDQKFGATLRQAISDNRVKIVIVDLETEAIAEWIM